MSSLPSKPLNNSEEKKTTPYHGYYSDHRQRLIQKMLAEDHKVPQEDLEDLKRTLKFRKKYDERLGPALVEFMSKGYSYEAFAGHIGVDISSLKDWEKKEEWIEWVNLGYAAALKYWEELMVKGSSGEKVNAKMAIFKIQNMFPDKYKTRIEVENNNPTTIIIEGLDGMGKIETPNEEAISLETTEYSVLDSPNTNPIDEV